MLAESIQTIREEGHFIFRAPTAGVSPEVRGLLLRSVGMGTHSRESSLNLCEHFASTCVVAEQGDNVDAFISDCISSKLPIDSVRKTLIGRRER